MDSPLYVRMAESFARAERSPGPAHPGYSLIVAAASVIGGDREWPGRVVALVGGLTLIVIVHRMALARGGATAAAIAAYLVAAHPLLAVYSTAVMTESAFLAVLFGGLLALDRGASRVGGGLLGLAWWIRPEAAVVGPIAIALAPGTARRRLVAGGLLLLVAAPSLLFLRWNQGYWSLTPKTALVAPAPEGERAAEWRLADSSRAIRDDASIGVRLAKTLPDVVARFPLRVARHATLLLEAWPLPLMLLAAIGLRRAVAPTLAMLALWPAFSMLAIPFDLRFHQLLVPALAMATACGAVALGGRGRFAAAAATLLLTLGVLWAWAGPAGTRALHFDDGPMAEMRGVGAWIASHSSPEDRIMDRKAYVAFFANRTHVQLPDDELRVIVDFAQREGVRWLIVEEYIAARARPQLRPLLEDPAFTATHEPRLRHAFGLVHEPGAGVVVFEVAPAP